jgi:putative peptide zinc metalloprotease protein
VLCPACRTVLARDAVSCGTCGRVLAGGVPVLELVLDDGRRIPVDAEVTLGRAGDNAVQLVDPSVSRHHARVIADDGGARLEDVGSSHGTLLDGRRLTTPQPLRDGSAFALGDVVVRVERRRAPTEAGRTRHLPAASSPADVPSGHLRLRGDLAVKRLDSEEGERRHVLRDEANGGFARLDDAHAELLALLDGGRTLPELIAEARRLQGDAGAGRLAALVADLGDRGWLHGIPAAPPPAGGRLARVLRPRELATTRAGLLFERVHRAGGFLLFTPPAAAALGLVALGGILAFGVTVIAGDRVPFVVGRNLEAGIAAFIAGRGLVVVVHELAHGLTVVAMGRHVPRAGLKFVAAFPYAFVDTSEAWLEGRRRRMAIAAAGPASDLVLGGAFSLLALAGGATGDVAFQLALGAYIGALMNLNPFLDRDGAQLLADHLRRPGLRRRAQAHLAAVLAGRPAGADGDGRLLLAHGIAGVVWSAAVLAFVVVLSLRYAEPLEDVASPVAVWSLLGVVWLVVALPIGFAVVRPLYERRNRPSIDRVAARS